MCQYSSLSAREESLQHPGSMLTSYVAIRSFRHSIVVVLRESRIEASMLLSPSIRSLTTPRIKRRLLMYRLKDGSLGSLAIPVSICEHRTTMSEPQGESNRVRICRRQPNGIRGGDCHHSNRPFIALKPVKQKGGKIDSRLGVRRGRLRPEYQRQQHLHDDGR